MKRFQGSSLIPEVSKISRKVLKMEFAVTILAIITIVISIHRERLYHRSLKQAYPVVDYITQSTADSDSWRWRSPLWSLDLVIENDDVSSRLILPFHHSFAEILTSLLGYFLAAIFVFFLPLTSLVDAMSGNSHGNAGASIFAVLLFSPLIWLMLNTERHTRGIELQPERIRIHMQYGIFLKRHINIHRHQKQTFAYAYQSWFSMSRGQEFPKFILIAKKTCCWMLTRKWRFYLRCNQSQGSWIVSGLNCWLHQNAE
jgi:hypothetical protein